jgi:hypothetical protein
MAAGLWVVDWLLCQYQDGALSFDKGRRWVAGIVDSYVLAVSADNKHLNLYAYLRSSKLSKTGTVVFTAKIRLSKSELKLFRNDEHIIQDPMVVEEVHILITELRKMGNL